MLALTACSSDTDAAGDTKPSVTAPATTTVPPAKDRKSSGIPPEPTGQARADLLAAIKAVAPDAVRYEDKAIDAARNQCHAINGGGNKLDWTASQRFTYKDVVTTEEQGKALNKALIDSGFCKTA
nr:MULTISPECIES: hypothetical protein [unclassified Streptomyces]